MNSITKNRILGNSSRAAAAQPHRVALANWPASSTTDARVATLDGLFDHVAAAGYDGVERAAHSLSRYFPTGASLATVAADSRRAAEKRNLQILGATLHCSDEGMRKLNWIAPMADQMKLVQDMGGQYIGVQVGIHPDYEKTGGAYRSNESYLRWCADRVTELRDAAYHLGMNFYLEVHVDRITEDPAACCKLLDLVDCELNGDMSHYLARGFLKGPHVERVLANLGHAHTRCARRYGDLSVQVPDPKADWEAKGATWQLFELMKPALAHGLSSRCITGESGPMHLVKDPLTQDQLLVPLWRAMARFADAGAQKIKMKVNEPTDLNPWG